jgi:hypothetical protein
MRLCLLLLAATGCTYSPPIRGLHAGMPDRLGRGQVELGGTAGGFSAPTTGGPHVAYGWSDTVVIEGGANLNFIEGLWATTWAGVRLLRAKDLSHELRLVGDLELGAGFGLGGRDYEGVPPPQGGSATPVPWTSRWAGGFYEGLGVGLRWRWLGACLRVRLDTSGSTGAPSTLWPSVGLGLEARAGRHVVFGLGGGAFSFWNENSGFAGPWFFYQATVALVFGGEQHVP